ncbi:hypothetical protein LSTR_LSTR012253 [Laodelphax striatellus]|uniref:Endonuclease/exonuclease/phosphatase domain-containing protein n=1 Tax=Laodelphax striatellus TaxID=195883 RepID=A0A482WL57_LAOST|nr:hypothetical protein LSTR_LSTR012253 [Laodelphax striatellus]
MLQSSWLTDSRLDAALHLQHGCLAVAQGMDMSGLSEDLREIETLIQTKRGEFVIGGDFNAKSPEWGDPREDRRGQILMDWSASLQLAVINQGTAPTFVRERSQSIIDITFASEGVAQTISSWKVLETETLSPHHHILFTSGFQARRHQQISLDGISSHQRTSRHSYTSHSQNFRTSPQSL